MPAKKWTPPEHMLPSLISMVESCEYDCSALAAYVGVSVNCMRPWVKHNRGDRHAEWKMWAAMGPYPMEIKRIACDLPHVSAKSISECYAKREQLERAAMNTDLSCRDIASKLKLKERAVYAILEHWGHDMVARKKRLASLAGKKTRKPKRVPECKIRPIPVAITMRWVNADSGVRHRYAG